jgi:ABC-2 type transport system permease protein
MLAYAMVIKITYPQTHTQWLYFSLVAGLAWWVSFSWRFIVNLTSFWVPNALGISRFFFMASLFFSGFLMPLRFFPEWIQQISFLTPFPYTVNALAEVYLGLLSPSDIQALIVSQILWGTCLLIIGQIILRLGIKKLVILGG